MIFNEGTVSVVKFRTISQDYNSLKEIEGYWRYKNVFFTQVQSFLVSYLFCSSFLNYFYTTTITRRSTNNQ